MPFGWDYPYYIKRKTWKTMDRYQRKQWYREHEFKPNAKKP